MNLLLRSDADIYVLATTSFIKNKTIQSALDKMLMKIMIQFWLKISDVAWYRRTNVMIVFQNSDMEQSILTSGFSLCLKEVFTEHRRRIGFNHIQEVDSVEAVDIDTKEDYEFALLISENMKIGSKSCLD